MISLDRNAVARFVFFTSTLVSAAQLGCGAMGSSKSPRSSGGYGGYAPTNAAGASGSGGGGDSDGYSAKESSATPSADYSGSAGAASGGGYAPTTAAPTSGAPMPKAPPPPIGKSAEDKAVSTATTGVTVTTTVTINPPTLPPPFYADDQGSPTGGLLTAAIWDDNIMRAQFATFLARYPSFRETWGMDLTRKVTIVVNDANGVPVGDAPIALRAPDGETIQLRTHGDGTALFYPTIAMSTPKVAMNANGQGQSTTSYAAAAQVGTLRTEVAFGIPQSDTTWNIKLTGVPARAALPALDVAIVLDTTGSMGDEIGYLQNELVGVMQRVKKEQAMRRVRLALVLYKDRGDEYVTKAFPFTEDLPTFLSELKQGSAMGGGDMPESVNAALADTVNALSWAGDETGRLAILVADAPPHYYADEQYTYKNASWDLSARGIKLVTLGASGIDKTTEYVFREMSAFTGGRYVFLTDDSGIGESHLVPDITGYQVEHLDRILVRIIRDEAKAFVR